MNKITNFSKRNLKEILRDPIVYIFCLGFPVIMLLLFQIISKYSGENTPIFKLDALLPAIIMFSYSFVLLSVAILVSKDRQTFFLKRLYSSPMKSYHYVLGYAFVGVLIGFFQTIVCILTGLIISIVSGTGFISFVNVLLLILSQLPILFINVFLGVLFGSILSDRSAPGVCSVVINVSGMLGGCWMPVESMGNFFVFCRVLPFYPSVHLGRIITGAKDVLGEVYTFNNVALLGLIPIAVFMILSVVLSFVVFKKNMTSDN